MHFIINACVKKLNIDMQNLVGRAILKKSNQTVYLSIVNQQKNIFASNATKKFHGKPEYMGIKYANPALVKKDFLSLKIIRVGRVADKKNIVQEKRHNIKIGELPFLKGIILHVKIAANGAANLKLII
jgi:hypothetical protein